jgi:hypothetical protein
MSAIAQEDHLTRLCAVAADIRVAPSALIAAMVFFRMGGILVANVAVWWLRLTIDVVP